jgi:hypothetical protein
LNEEQRAEFDRQLETAAATLEGKPRAPKSRAPSWWKGDAAAGQSMLDAARQMGYSLGEVRS